MSLLELNHFQCFIDTLNISVRNYPSKKFMLSCSRLKSLFLDGGRKHVTWINAGCEIQMEGYSLDHVFLLL